MRHGELICEELQTADTGVMASHASPVASSKAFWEQEEY